MAIYRRRARQSGHEVQVLPWAIAGLVLLALLVATVPLVGWLRWAPDVVPTTRVSDWNGRGLGPVFVMVLTLPILAWVEHNLHLAVTIVFLLGIVVFADLYDVSNVLGPVGPSIGLTANLVLVGFAFLVAGWAARGHERPGPRKRVIQLP